VVPVTDNNDGGGGGDAAELSPHQKLSSLCLTLLQRDWSEGDSK